MARKEIEIFTSKNFLEKKFSPSGGKSLTSVLDAVQRKSKEDVVRASERVPMIFLKHRWMRNRNEVVNTTVVSFDDQGIAKVPSLGNAILDCQVLVRKSGGLIEFFDPSVQSCPPKDPPREAPKGVLKVVEEHVKQPKDPLGEEPQEEPLVVEPIPQIKDMDERTLKDEDYGYSFSEESMPKVDDKKAVRGKQKPVKGKKRN